MIQINVTVNAKPAIDLLTDVQKKHVPFAMARALSMTALRVKDAEVREIKDVFDRPTPYILSSVVTTSATKQKLVATVGIKDRTSGTLPSKILGPHIFGGARGEKPYEKMLRSIGVLPEGYVTVPGEGAKIDQYGNMSRGQIVQILSYFQAFQLAGYTANITAKRKAKLAKGTKKKIGFAYFVGRPADGKLPWGIWQRFNLAHGSAIKPILLFVTRAQYQPVFDFYYVAKHVVERDFARQFEASLKEALAGSAAHPA